MKGTRRARVLTAALLGSAVLAGCGGGGSDAGPATTTAPKLPAACAKPPVTVDLEAGGEHEAGSKAFDATDAVARRIAILPGEMAFDPAALSGLESKAGITPLASYTIYLADFRVPRTELSGVGLTGPTPPAGKTVGAISIVPTTEAGFGEGDVVTAGELDYETNSTLMPLSATVFADKDTTAQAYTDVKGQVKILQLSEKSICIDFDITLENQGELIYAAKGAVLAPVVRAANATFFT